MSDDMMTSGSVNWGWVIFLILILWFFIGGGFGFGPRAAAAGAVASSVYGANTAEILALTSGKAYGTTNCDLEKNAVRQEAQIRYDIENQANLTRANDTANANMIATKIDFYAYQDLRDKLAESQRQNTILENKMYSDAKFGSIEAQLAEISNSMAKAPQLYSVSAACPPSAVISGCGCSGNGNVLY